MNLDIDGGKLLYALGVAFALGALLYFIRDVVFGLSITVTAALLLVAFVGFFIGGLAIDRDALDVVAYAVSALTYTVFLGYVVTRYETTETGIFILLTISAVLFVGLGYGLRTDQLRLSRRTARSAAVVLVAVSLVLVGADVATGDVQYSVEIDDRTTVTISQTGGDDSRVQGSAEIGALTVANPPPFSRSTSLPSVRGCLVGTNASAQDVFVQYTPQYYGSDRLAGGEERTHGIEARIIADTNETGELEFAIERHTDCDVTREEPTIVIVLDDDALTSSPR